MELGKGKAWQCVVPRLIFRFLLKNKTKGLESMRKFLVDTMFAPSSLSLENTW